MAQRKTGRRRGRPRKANAKRRCTTRIGRKTGLDPVDTGTVELLAKRRAAAAGSISSPSTRSASSRRTGRSTPPSFATLRRVEHWLGQVRRARGISDGHVSRLWAQLLIGARGGRAGSVSGRAGRTAADVAWARLLDLREAFGRAARPAAGARNL